MSIGRRACLAAGAGLFLAPGLARAGGQIEEPLADAVRTALSSAVANSAPPEPQFATTEARLHYLRWLGTMSNRLRRRKADLEVRREFLQTDIVLVGILLYALLGKLADLFAKALERWWLRWHPGYQGT